MTMQDYHQKSDVAMESLLDQMEALLDREPDDSFDVDYHSGVLTLNLGSHGTYVINKQPPNKQIWLSSPISGPKRYDFVEETGLWVYARDGVSIDDLLSKELTDILKKETTISL